MSTQQIKESVQPCSCPFSMDDSWTVHGRFMDGILTDCLYDGLVEQVINEKVQKGVEQQTWTVFKSSGGGGQETG